MRSLGSVIGPYECDRVAALEAEVRSSADIIGQSAAWVEALRQAERVARLDTTTCLQGESGTGKEVLARFIHRSSPRRHGPFVAINCAALPEHLVESELFGFERGAFTGAQQAKAGRFELATRGVLFLDEISELALSAQAKMLRVLEEREFQRLGGTRAIASDARVIVAANRDLHDAVLRGTFRQDLYYRLNVFEIRLPPLRERRDDIVPLARSFLHRFTQSNGLPATDIAPDALARLVAHPWPGNVRELRNVIERATIVCDGTMIRERDLALAPVRAIAEENTTLQAVEQRAIQRAMRDANGNRSRAARLLGISRTQLYARLRKHDLEGGAS